MYQGNWKCSQCGGAITDLPFQPKSEKGLTCRACWSAQNNKNKGSAPASRPDIGGASEEPPYDIPDGAGLAGEPMPGDGFDGMDAAPVTPGEKPKFEGDWQCAGCGASITSLPFNPRNTDNLKCIDCFKRSKQ
jgi:CxxC-x17-CxxC domain-containing protein